MLVTHEEEEKDDLSNQCVVLKENIPVETLYTNIYYFILFYKNPWLIAYKENFFLNFIKMYVWFFVFQIFNDVFHVVI